MTRYPLVPPPVEPAQTEQSSADAADASSPYASDTTDAFQRLVVVIPDVPLEEGQLAKTIWSLTNANHAEVLLLTLSDDWSRESHIRLQHTLVMQLLSTAGVRASSAIVADEDWLSILGRELRPHDVLLCFAEHLIATDAAYWTRNRPAAKAAGASVTALAKPQPISALINQELHWPAHVVSGILQPPKRNLLLTVMSWLGIVAVIVGGFWLQVELAQALREASSLLRGLLLSGAIVVELGALLTVFHLFR